MRETILQIWLDLVMRERGGLKATYLSVASDDRVSHAVQNVDALGVSTDVDGLRTGWERHWCVDLLCEDELRGSKSKNTNLEHQSQI
jgi:hypothetical protein